MLLGPAAMTAAPAAEREAVTEVGASSLHGTLVVPAGGGAVDAVLNLAGSGPTDRDGNGPGYVNNSWRPIGSRSRPG